MINIKNRIKKIEESLGVHENKMYYFAHFGYRTLSYPERQDLTYCQKGNFKGYVLIYERQGKEFAKKVKFDSEEEARLLEERGYEILNKQREAQHDKV